MKHRGQYILHIVLIDEKATKLMMTFLLSEVETAICRVSESQEDKYGTSACLGA